MDRTTDIQDEDDRINRRAFLGATGAVAATAAARPAAASDGSLEDWFEDVDDYSGVVNKTGQESVRVAVGSGDGFGFDPVAVRVDPGTTIVWEWTGAGGSHNVVENDGAFESELVGDAGYEFEHTFGNEGVYKYYCSPHEAMGMKGAVVVGDETSGAGTGTVSSASQDPPLLKYGASALGGALWTGIVAYTLWAFNRRKRPSDNTVRTSR